MALIFHLMKSCLSKNRLLIVDERKELDALIIPLIENWSIERLGVPTKINPSACPLGAPSYRH